MNTPPPTAPPDLDTMISWGSQLINALLDTPGVAQTLGRDLWTRARTALETGCSTASFSEAVSKTAAKLQIDGALPAKTSEEIVRLGRHLADPAVFGAWAELMRRDAVYVIAIARVDRKTRKPATSTVTSADDDTERVPF